MGKESNRRNFLQAACKTGLTLVGLGVIVGKRDAIASKMKDVLDTFDPIPSNEGIEKMIDGYVNDSVFDSYLADMVNERTIPHLEERLFVIRCINDPGSSQEMDSDFISEMLVKVSTPSEPVVLLDRVSIMHELRNHLRDIAVPVYNVNKPRSEHDAWFHLYAPGVLKARIEQAVTRIRENYRMSQIAKN